MLDIISLCLTYGVQFTKTVLLNFLHNSVTHHSQSFSNKLLTVHKGENLDAYEYLLDKYYELNAKGKIPKEDIGEAFWIFKMDDKSRCR